MGHFKHSYMNLRSRMNSAGFFSLNRLSRAAAVKEEATVH